MKDVQTYWRPFTFDPSERAVKALARLAAFRFRAFAKLVYEGEIVEYVFARNVPVAYPFAATARALAI